MSITRNRVIYAGTDVLVSDAPSWSGHQTGVTSLKLLKRVQDKKNKELSAIKNTPVENQNMNEKYNNENRAERFIDAVIDNRKKLDEKKILKEKYNLIKEIKENYQIDDFLKSQVPNYKVLASVYKIFEFNLNTENAYDPKDFVNTKFSLVEHLIAKPISNAKVVDKINEALKKEDKEIRLLTYKMLVENFNKKYKSLNERQKGILKEYINSFTNSENLKLFIANEVVVLNKALTTVGKQIKDKVTKIKLAETINQLNKIKTANKITDTHITSVIMGFELEKELRGTQNGII